MRVAPTTQEIIELTSGWDGDRSADGRPRVSDDVLAQLSSVTSEQAWQVLDAAGFPRQFTGGWRTTRPGAVLVGRALTCRFLPYRPDYDAAVVAAGRGEGHLEADRQNSWVVESLDRGDVMVADIFGKITEGTVIGDNLGTAVAVRTHAGALIDGGVRDLEGLTAIESAVFFYRAADPTPIKDVVLAGLNTPVGIGGVTILPGDIVHGTATGVTIIPPQLASAVVTSAADVRLRDEFGKEMISARRYSSADIDVPTWPDSIEAHFAQWRSERA